MSRLTWPHRLFWAAIVLGLPVLGWLLWVNCTEAGKKLKFSLDVKEDHHLAQNGLFLLAGLTMFWLAFVAWGLTVNAESRWGNFGFTNNDWKYTLELFKFPIGCLAAGLAAMGFVATIHRSAQTAIQINHAKDISGFDRYLTLRKEFLEEAQKRRVDCKLALPSYALSSHYNQFFGDSSPFNPSFSIDSSEWDIFERIPSTSLKTPAVMLAPINNDEKIHAWRCLIALALLDGRMKDQFSLELSQEAVYERFQVSDEIEKDAEMLSVEPSVILINNVSVRLDDIFENIKIQLIPRDCLSSGRKLDLYMQEHPKKIIKKIDNFLARLNKETYRREHFYLLIDFVINRLRYVVGLMDFVHASKEDLKQQSEFSNAIESFQRHSYAAVNNLFKPPQ